MEHLRHDDPARIGPYVLLAALDARDGGRPSPERRYIARRPDGDGTVLLCLPRPGIDAARWYAEAQGAHRLSSVPGFLPVHETGHDPSGAPWYAAPYAPALPLSDALAAHHGPLPVAFVLALGVALARSLAAVHALGAAHAGLCPATVLLTSDGPRTTGFGAVRAVGPGRAAESGQEPASIAPEQLTGGLPRPLGDVYALGTVLAYASTGHTVPESAELPLPLRTAVSGCLARDPAARPDAARLAAALADGGAAVRGGAGATVLDGVFPVPLPAQVAAELVRQSGEVLAAELPVPAGTPTAPTTARS
ncbi:serine/threonine protein kinase [Streptomyces fimicarius]|uniref:serine/threonine protein kinase n=1 Tax=Streptomyces griseus TaxID=1911 RepID=UPI00331E185B